MLTYNEIMAELERVYGKKFRNLTAATNITRAQERKFRKDDKNFATYVGQRLANYADGAAGYLAHDVLYGIQQEWEQHYGFLPRPEWEE